MRYQRTSERRAVILMVVLSLLTLFALVGVTFVLYADAEATAARVAREAQTIQTADVNPQEALAYFLGQFIYDVPDTTFGVGSGLRGHSLARTMYGLNYLVPPGPSLNVVPFNGIGRLHYASASGVQYPGATPLTNVPNKYAGIMDDYALVNYTWFSSDGFVRDPERFGVRNAAQLTGNLQPNPYVGCNAPYTYPDLNNFFLAAMKADGTVLTPSYHRPWLFQVVNGKFYAFNDMTNPNWTNTVGKYLTLRPRPFDHPSFPPPADATGDVKNLPWAPGGNDSIWIDLGAPVMTAPDGTLYKMMFAPLIIDLDGRINLNTAGNLLGYIANMTAPTSWQQASNAHVSNQGWGPWEVNLSKVLWADGVPPLWQPSTPATPPEWMRLLTGMSPVIPMPPNALPVVQPGVLPIPPLLPPSPTATLSAWLLPGVRGRYLETMSAGIPLWTPISPGTVYLAGGPGLNGTYPHTYSQIDSNGLNDTNLGASPSSRLAPPGFGGTSTYPFPLFPQGYCNGGLMPVPPSVAGVTENTNHPALYNIFQSPLLTSLGTRAFRASDMEFLLRPNTSINGPVDTNASAINSDLQRLCPLNFVSDAQLSLLPANVKALALRFRNLVTTQSWDVGAPGVTPYWWNGMDPNAYSGYWPKDAVNTNWPTTPSTQLAPYAKQPAQGAALAFPPLPPTLATSTLPSEFGPDWRSLAANAATYFASSNANPPGYVTPGARIRLNRPLPPYPHMGALLTPPYNSLPPTTPAPYGVTYDTTPNGPIMNQFTAAQNARQALANDIYRRLLAIAGPSTVFNNAANPAVQSGTETTAQFQSDLGNLAARRWLAQLAVNIVDYIDEDDVMTPFNFYTVADGLAATSLGQTLGGDDPGAPNPTTNNYLGANTTGANPAYWVFGTELPKVVLNEVLALAYNPNPTNPTSGGNPVPLTDSVKVWVELMNTMPAAGTGGTNIQPQDAYRVPLYMTPNALPGSKGYSPYRVSIAEFTMERANAPVNGNIPNPPFAPGAPNANPGPSGLPNDGSNVLGKAYVGQPWTQCPQSTTDADFSGIIPLIGGGNQPTYPGTAVQAGVDVPNGAPGGASQFFLIGPPNPPTATVTNPSNTANTTNVTYPDPFVAANPTASPPTLGVPQNTPVVRTPNMQYTPNWASSNTYDERTNGVNVMLRRLANPYLPPQLNPGLPNYNPYVTVDYIPSVPLQTANAPNISTFGKRQPYAGLNLPPTPPPTGTIVGTPPVYVVNYGQPPQNQNQLSPVTQQGPTGTGGAYTTPNTNITSTFGVVTGNFPLPQSGHYDWLVHLDRPPISPMELLHVSAWAPYKLTQQFMLSSDTQATASVNGTTINATFAHYAPWFDGPPYAYPGISGATPLSLSNMICPWWFDPTVSGGANYLTPPPTSHRLYRLFEFLECGDRAFGVNGLGRIPGKVNINTVWDAEILQALIDANTNIGIAQNSANTPLNLPGDVVSQIFTNMMISRSPSYYNQGTYTNPIPIGPVNMGTGVDDRPFMPLSTGLYLPAAPGVPAQFPNGIGLTTDTLLRTNNPFGTKSVATGNMLAYPGPQTAGTPTPSYMLFQNYTDTQATHPYYQTQLLTKLYNNITTRSNTFAVFLTVGFFQVTNPLTSPPQLGPEIGRSEGKHIRHRMFAIVDRTNLTTFTTTGQAVPPATVVSGPTAAPLNLTGVQTIQIPAPVTPTNPNTTVVANPASPLNQLLVANPLMVPISTPPLWPGLIQAGTQLVIDPGNINEETVTVISVTPPAIPGGPAFFTANFTLPHGAGNTPFTIVQRGNPGPWVLTPYDPRLDSSVVQYFSIID